MIIGITGSSGSGKTTFSRILAKKLNYKLINADEIVKKLYNKDENYYKEIVKAFGKKILNENQEIIREKLAEIIFNNEEERIKINTLTFKYVVQEIKKQVENNSIIDAPLLFESNLNTICDTTIAIIADEKVKIERIVKRDNIKEEKAKERLDAQPKDEFYIKNADIVIYNNEDIMIEKQVEELLFRLNLKIM